MQSSIFILIFNIRKHVFTNKIERTLRFSHKIKINITNNNKTHHLLIKLNKIQYLNLSDIGKGDRLIVKKIGTDVEKNHNNVRKMFEIQIADQATTNTHENN